MPFDSDGFRIWTDSGDVGFQMQLRSTVNNLLSATCELWWDTQASQYESADCVVPDTSLAGSWELEVSLHDGAFYSTSIHVKCAAGFYEVDHASFLGDETMWTCTPCPPNDATCRVGSTLSALPLQSGFWRAGADRHIHQNARSLTLFVCVVWTQARNLLIFEVVSSRHSGAPSSAIPLNTPTVKATTKEKTVIARVPTLALFVRHANGSTSPRGPEASARHAATARITCPPSSSPLVFLVASWP